MLVRDAMTADAAWVSVERTVKEAAQLMRKMEIGCMPVMEGDRLVGLVTDRDITCRVVAEGRNPDEVRVRAIMTAEPVCCFEDQSLDEAVDLMEANGIRRLPVLNRNKQISGLLSVDDIARHAAYELTGRLMHFLCMPERMRSVRLI
jgi:CBS domain-containing protein